MQRVTITHPFHPLHGQQVEVIRIQRGADPDLIIRQPDGRHAAVAMSWTNYASVSAVDPPAEPPPLLDGEGLRQAAQFIDRLRREGRYPLSDETDEPCPP